MSAAAERDGVTIEPLGESALLIRFGDGIDAALNARVHAAVAMLARAGLPGIVDVVPSYATLGLHYDPSAWTDDRGGPPARNVEAALRAIFGAPPASAAEPGARVEIPVSYGGEYGPDLEALAQHADLDAAAVVAMHSAASYRVAMLGFAPGFPYLIGLDPRLRMPRRATPRTRVPAGSVAIGGAQTGIYPSALPGGWQVIGRTPLALFDPARDPPALAMPGDRIRFFAIEPADFEARRAEALR